jgi:kynurenine aminotransferase
MVREDPFKPAARVAGQRQDVWSIVNEAAAAYNQEHGAGSVVNMGQGFFGYNPPEFVLDAARDALGKVECNQYSPTKVCRTSQNLLRYCSLGQADNTQ